MMAVTTVIVPVNTTRDCIVEAGKKYCESGDGSLAVLGVIIICSVALVVYLDFLSWLYLTKGYNGYVVWGLGIALPALVIGTLLIIS